jgi:hypothetical protein
MSYHGVVNEAGDAFVVNIMDAAGRSVGTFTAFTRIEAETNLSHLLKTLHEGLEAGLGPFNARHKAHLNARKLAGE